VRNPLILKNKKEPKAQNSLEEFDWRAVTPNQDVRKTLFS